MSGAPKHPNENERLKALASYDILDTPPEASFDRLVQLAATLTGAPVALVSLVDRRRLWFKASVGLDVREVPRAQAFCAWAIVRDDVLVVEDATRDGRFADDPLVTNAPHIRFYAGAPLVNGDGHVLGSLCVMDTTSRPLSSGERRILLDLAAAAVDAMELHRSRHQLARKCAELDRANNNLRVVNQQLESVGAIDPLTGIANRRALDQHIEREMRRAARRRGSISLLLVDVDNFTTYNDHYGRQAGDRCLEMIAGVLKAVLHRPADMAAHYGGATFAILLPETDALGALQVAEITREEIEGQRIPHAGHPQGVVTVSIGACCIVPDIGDAQPALSTPAEQALYRAKEQGRNQVCATEQTALAAREASWPHVTRH